MWPFSSTPDPALRAAATVDPVASTRAAMGGASRVPSALAAARPWLGRAGLAGAALGLGMEAYDPSPETQAVAQEAADDLRARFGRSTLEGLAAIPRHQLRVMGTAAYQGIAAPVVQGAGSIARGLFGLDAPQDMQTANLPARAPAPTVWGEREQERPYWLAPTRDQPPSLPVYAGMTMEQAMHNTRGLPTNRAQAAVMGQWAARAPARAPTGRDMLAMDVLARLREEGLALETQRERLGPTAYAAQSDRLLRRYISALGANPVNSTLAEQMQDVQ